MTMPDIMWKSAALTIQKTMALSDYESIDLKRVKKEGIHLYLKKCIPSFVIIIYEYFSMKNVFS